ncbi:hypothetical protein ASPVEDRAFT_292674 [Aspergillus versicolor CBS 583.65]|uniref:Ubiquitin-like domain-containing protein n=1 Tax=Aspergillus versicolor CBS 583.65 TaxID=1036611 RepID=A0A1L9P7K6_ASPVE|nr:uncharacterized protein ASPVEDRAFT_292674 [Aspergillus versicolor CBS 583.65]OJI97423.1 hypothetical protein ASPVEDRAFT_292674 [Aspergillus versicolor CBS 583.65]
MGCCFSVSRDSHDAQSPSEEHHHHHNNHDTTNEHSSTRPRRPSSLISPSSSSRHRPPLILNHHPSSSRQSRQKNPPKDQTPVPLPEHINAPIRPHIWNSKKRRWTRTLLDRERTEFFETRVTGRPEVWVALSAALTFMRNEDFATAQSIIDAAGVTVPTGDLCQGCYDEQGVLYRLPRCIVSDPDNIVVDADEDGSTDGEDVDVGFEAEDRKDFGDEVESGDELIAEDGESERRRDEKGKASERDLIRVKARLSDRDGEDLVVTVNKAQNVGFLARKVQQEVGIPRTQRVRIAYLGKLLKENTPLVDQGWKPGNVVNAMVVARRPSTSS